MPAPATSRERLIGAAIAIIEAEGEAGVRVDRVAEMAEVAKPSLYHYFGDRAGLIVAAQAQRYRQAMVIVEIDQVLAIESRVDFARAVLTAIDSYSSPEGAVRRRLRIQVLGSAVSRPDLQLAIREAHEYSVRELTRVITFGQKLGWVSSRFSASSIVEWWFGVVLGRHLVEEYGKEADAIEWKDVTLHMTSMLLFEEDLTALVGR